MANPKARTPKVWHLCAWTLSSVIAIIVEIISIPTPVHAMGDERFEGPFPTWENVQAQDGAKGDGVTDDTLAIQAALDHLGHTSNTLFFPPGIYRITRTLHLRKQLYINVIGAEPSATKLVWNGDHSPMLDIDGVAYSRFDRLTFDGANTASVAVDQSYSGKGGNFDTGNQYADDTFERTGIGFLCGDKGFGCAETSMLRDRFLDASIAGLAMKNFNALDMFVWDSVFEDCRVAATNDPGAGNFHVYESVFKRSKLSDILIQNTGLFNFRWNYSIGSRRFIQAGFTNNPALITVASNQIIDTGDPISVSASDLGPILLLDNTIRSRDDGGGPVVRGTGNPTDILSLGNTFTRSSPIIARGHIHSISDVVVQRAAVNPRAPALAPTPQSVQTDVFEVQANASEVEIQHAINAAAKSRWPFPIVHIPVGDHKIKSTIIVPKDRSIEIVGDGGASRLTWEGQGNGPIIFLSGPSHAILKEISIDGHGHQANGIVVDNADQRDGMIFMESPFLSNSRTNLSIDGLVRTRVELHDFEHSGARNQSHDAVSVDVRARAPSTDDGSTGGVVIFGGASSSNDISYALSGGGRLSINDIWYEGAGTQVAHVTGDGAFFYAGSRLALPNCPEGASIGFHDFRGSAVLMNLLTDCNLHLDGDSSKGQIAALGLVSGRLDPLKDDSEPAAPTVIVLDGQTTAESMFARGSVQSPEIGNLDPALAARLLAQVHEDHPTHLRALPLSVTDVRIYRVFVENADVAIHLTARGPDK